MIIAIDGYEANVKNRVGIGRYAYEIIKNIYLLRSAVSCRIYLPNPPLPDMPRETEWWRYRVISPKQFWTFVGLPLALLRDQPSADVVFSPTHYVPRFISIPRVMSIMDLSYLAYPKMFRFRDLYKLVLWTKYSVANASRICTISEFTKNAIINQYGVSEERVVVTYPGLSMELKAKSEKSKIIDKYNVSSHYILSVGTLQPRKNYVRLIEAFAEFLRENKQKFGEIQLVIIGKKGWLYEEILEAPAVCVSESKVSP
jgi:glycosyltransferase involved in cell wall biosynthesis